MAFDPAYNSNFQRLPNGSVVMGNATTFEFGSSCQVASTPGFIYKVPTLDTTANSTFPCHGLLTIENTSTNATTHTIGAPRAGCELTIHCLDVSTVSTGHLIGTGSTAVTLGSSGLRFIRFTDRDKSITLMGQSTSRYIVKAIHASGVALST